MGHQSKSVLATDYYSTCRAHGNKKPPVAVFVVWLFTSLLPLEKELCQCDWWFGISHLGWLCLRGERSRFIGAFCGLKAWCSLQIQKKAEECSHALMLPVMPAINCWKKISIVLIVIKRKKLNLLLQKNHTREMCFFGVSHLLTLTFSVWVKDKSILDLMNNAGRQEGAFLPFSFFLSPSNQVHLMTYCCSKCMNICMNVWKLYAFRMCYIKTPQHI